MLYRYTPESILEIQWRLTIEITMWHIEQSVLKSREFSVDAQ